MTDSNQVSLEEILNTENVATILSDEKLSEIAAFNRQIYNLDLQSRSEKQKQLTELVNLALLISEEKSFPWDNASNVKFPLIAQAALDFGSKCYPEIIRGNNVVKAKIIGSDEGQPMVNMEGQVIPMIGEDGQPVVNEDGQIQPMMQNVGAKQAQGDRVSEFMNWQLLQDVHNFEKDMDVLCHTLPVVGTMFKKVFYNVAEDKPVSELIFPDKIIVNDKAKNIENATITHLIELYPQEVQSRVRNDIFIDFDPDDKRESIEDKNVGVITNNNDTESLGVESLDSEDDDVSNNTELFLEQHCYLDLDGDDFLEPYIVTIHSASNKIVRIMKRFDKRGIKRNSRKEVSHIEAQHFFVKYGFLPSIDGSFYDRGIAHYLLNTNNAINSSLNQLIDAGTLNNTGGGFLGRGVKIKGGQVNLRPGEWKMADVTGGALKDNIVPIPHPQPSAVLMELFSSLSASGERVASLNDTLDGHGAANVSPTAIMTMVEQGTKKFKSVYKRIHRSLRKEVNMIYDLNFEFLSNKKYAEVLDEPLSEVNKKGDFNRGDFDIIPVTDIESVTNMQKLAKANFLTQFINDPFVDQLELRRRILGAVGIEGFDDLLQLPPPPAPDPLVQMEMEKNKVRARELEIKAAEAEAAIAKIEIGIEEQLADITKTKTESLLNIAKTNSTNQETNLKTREQDLETIRDITDRNIAANTSQTEQVPQSE